jgi:hypothetical protein
MNIPIATSMQLKSGRAVRFAARIIRFSPYVHFSEAAFTLVGILPVSG